MGAGPLPAPVPARAGRVHQPRRRLHAATAAGGAHRRRPAARRRRRRRPAHHRADLRRVAGAPAPPARPTRTAPTCRHNDNWIHELNLDPRHRVAAGFGGDVVRKHQEDYMEAAWEQVGDVLAHNQKVASRARPGSRSTTSCTRSRSRPLAEAPPSRLLALTAPCRRACSYRRRHRAVRTAAEPHATGADLAAMRRIVAPGRPAGSGGSACPTVRTPGAARGGQRRARSLGAPPVPPPAGAATRGGAPRPRRARCRSRRRGWSSLAHCDGRVVAAASCSGWLCCSSSSLLSPVPVARAAGRPRSRVVALLLWRAPASCRPIDEALGRRPRRPRRRSTSSAPAPASCSARPPGWRRPGRA